MSSDLNAGSPEKLCELLEIDRPVILAPMSPISGGRLAAAVTNSGGLGVIGAGFGDAESLERQMRLTEGARVGIGLINWSIDQATVELALSYNPAVIWLSFGDSSPFIPAIQARGAKVLCQVFSVDEAESAAGAGADVIVVQGKEAGGHGTGSSNLAALIEGVHNRLPGVPLVAAGGINSVDDLNRVRGLGAWGVSLGTAYYATHEAVDSDQAKEQLVRSAGEDTVRGTVFDIVRGSQWPTGFDGRSLRNEMTELWMGREEELLNDRTSQAARYEEAVRQQDMNLRVLWAGEGVGAVDRIVPAAEITQRFPISRA